MDERHFPRIEDASNLPDAGALRWYYTDGENSVGPFSEERLSGLHAAGVISDSTLVCPAGHQEWITFAEAVSDSHTTNNEADPKSLNAVIIQTPDSELSRSGISKIPVVAFGCWAIGCAFLVLSLAYR